MYSHYEINVSKNGKHFFATAPRSAKDLKEAEKIHDEMKNRFPESEGFAVSCTYIEVRINNITF